MDQLVDVIVQRTGLPRDQAEHAAQAAIEFLKGRLPGPIASQLDTAISGGAMGGGVPGQAQQALGGIPGQAQQDLGGMLGQQPQPPQP